MCIPSITIHGDIKSSDINRLFTPPPQVIQWRFPAIHSWGRIVFNVNQTVLQGFYQNYGVILLPLKPLVLYAYPLYW